MFEIKPLYCSLTTRIYNLKMQWYHWMPFRLSLKLSVGKVSEERLGWTMLCWPQGPVKTMTAPSFRNLHPGFTSWRFALTDTFKDSCFLFVLWSFPCGVSHGLATGHPHKYTDTWSQGKIMYNQCMHVYFITMLRQQYILLHSLSWSLTIQITQISGIGGNANFVC